ncbi:MAG: hypothetical protein LKJ57_01840 [Ancrocorticia sp.]|jgi:hypothetical protein|nr:hypothetical protein [Ancrocorticia sp.]MCI1932364.1 hypothetical protein [Ancrocorticia sp.]MCI1962977.1 hypothetical protein [Ancrocorticia sp.]MCI2001345.1 hypothetical protein [Ancrocorticia sp.]MCI2012330.1 hypothetical protein [Ancrocorticia sp.]
MMMNSILRHFAFSIARGTVAMGALGLSAIVAPAMVMRAQDPPVSGALIYSSLFFGLLAIVVVMAQVMWAGKLAPRRSSTRLAATYVGESAGLLVSAARYLAFTIMAVFGAALTVEGLTTIVSLGDAEPWVLIAVVALMALPTILGKPVSWRLVFLGVVIGVGTLGCVLALALVNEVMGNEPVGDFVASGISDVYVQRDVHVVAESLVTAAFPAAVIALISERSLSRVGQRRLPARRLIILTALAVIAISVTSYFTVTLHLRALSENVPTLALAASYLGRPGYVVTGIAYMCLGLAVTSAAYWSLPRHISELAVERLLPQYLASDDVTRPRIISMGLTALLAAIFSPALTDSQAGTVIFVFAVFTMLAISSITMVARGRSVLKESVDRTERSSAKASAIGFTVCGVAAVGMVVLVIVANAAWALFSTFALAFPVALLLFFRRGRVRAVQKLTPTDLTAGRTLPTRIHGVVLLTRLDMPTLRALTFARAARLSSLTAVTLDFEADATAALRAEWKEASIPVNLTVLGTPQGASTSHIVDFVRSLRALRPSDIVMVFVPRIIAASMWQRFFIRHTTPRVVSALRLEEGVVICEVPYQLAPEEADE